MQKGGGVGEADMSGGGGGGRFMSRGREGDQRFRFSQPPPRILRLGGGVIDINKTPLIKSI